MRVSSLRRSALVRGAFTTSDKQCCGTGGNCYAGEFAGLSRGLLPAVTVIAVIGIAVFGTAVMAIATMVCG